MRSVVTRSVVSAVATAAVSASLAAQSLWQNGEFRPSPADKPALQILVGDFTRRSTGDVLLHEATVRNQATTVFDLFAQDADGDLLRVQSPVTGQWTGPVPGPLFLTGTPIAVPATQDPAAIVQIDKLSLDADGRFDDLVALTSTGKLLVFPNRGQSAYGAGFPDLDSNGAYTLYDFADPANGFGIATLHPIYSCLATGDFDGNGGVDIAVGAFGLTNVGVVGVGGVTHTSFGLFVFWCRHTQTGSTIVPLPGDFEPVPQQIDLGPADALDLEWSSASGPGVVGSPGTLHVLAQEQCTPVSLVGASSIFSFRFGLVGANGQAPQLVPANLVQTALSFPGRVTSLAVGRLDADVLVDFAVAGNSSACLPLGGAQPWLQFLPGRSLVVPPTSTSPAVTWVAPDPALQWLQQPPHAANLALDLQGLQVLDADGDGQLDLGGLVAYGADPQENPSAKTADYVAWLGPLTPASPRLVHTTNVFFPLLYRFWSGAYPHFLAAPKATQVADFDRDGRDDVFVAGVAQLAASATDPWPAGGGVAVLKNVPTTSVGPYVRDYGTAELAPQGPTGREILVDLVGGRPVPGAQFDLEVAGLSSGQLVAFFFDTTASALTVPTPTLAGPSKPLTIHAMPQFVWSLHIVPPGPTALGDVHSHRLSIPFDLPGSAALVGFQANVQAVLFDPAQGAFFGSQGLELRVGN